LPTDIRLLDYSLPQRLIAQQPAERRDESRLLILRRDTGDLEQRAFRDIAGHARSGDLFVVNDSRVFPARLFVNRTTGGRVEILFLNQADEGGALWKCLARPARRLREGEILFHGSPPAPFCRFDSKNDSGIALVEILRPPLFPFLAKHGIVPLPPYINDAIDDPERYQTVYAEREGSAAAPTAGLHFTPELIKTIKAAGARFASVTLHIGLDTFKPIATSTVEAHEIHTEVYFVPDETARLAAQTVREGGRVIAVGTTAVRCLETWAAGKSREELAGAESGSSGATSLFIHNRSQFRIVDAMITNFHLPRTSLLALVAAFAGLDNIMSAYKFAIDNDYRFYSLGDAMFIY